MQTLQDLLLELKAVSSQQINSAIFNHSNLSLLEALARNLGKEREDFLRNALSEKLGIPLLEDEEVEMSEELIAASDPLALAALIDLHSSVPVAKKELAGKSYILLAVCDPLNKDAISAFSALFNLPARIGLAREQAIKNAYAAKAAVITLSAREKLAERKETSVSEIGRFVEDPEARKAQQQVAATAVKHAAERVVVDLESLFTKVQFHFEDKASSLVEISVASSAFLASFLRRGQIIQRDELSFEASCRIDFKSSAVYCAATVRSEAPASSGEAPRWKWLEISDFSIEKADDPNFWQSIAEVDSFQVRRLFKPQSGLTILCGSQKSARELAAHALCQSYPDLQLIDCGSSLVVNKEIYQQAKEERVVALFDGNSVWEILEKLISAPPEWKSELRGIIAYHHIPRLCECCTVPCKLSEETAARIPSWVTKAPKQDFHAPGCMVCLEKGFLGVIGACSVFVNEGQARATFLNARNVSEIPRILQDDDFHPLLESALAAARHQHTSVAAALEAVPDLPRAISSARIRYQNNTSSPKAEATQVFRPQGTAVDSSARREEETLAQSNLRKRAVTLGPLFDDDLVSSRGPSSTSEDSPLLLIIDDDPDQRSILRRVFELEGYRVEAAADGIDGIVSANRLHPSLIIVDFMMPDLDGRETIRRLKKNEDTKNIPVLALTAYPDPDVEYGLLKAGAEDFCSKAVAKKVLLKRIERLLSPE